MKIKWKVMRKIITYSMQEHVKYLCYNSEMALKFFNIATKEVSIDKPYFIDSLSKKETYCFIDFRMSHFDYIHRRIVEYSVLRCRMDTHAIIDKFHCLAKNTASPTNNKVQWPLSNRLHELLGYSQEHLNEARDTWEVFKDFHKFIKNSTAIIFNGRYHMEVMKMYMLRLELNYIRSSYRNTETIAEKYGMTEQMENEYNGYVRAYKSLLLCDKFKDGFNLSKPERFRKRDNWFYERPSWWPRRNWFFMKKQRIWNKRMNRRFDVCRNKDLTKRGRYYMLRGQSSVPRRYRKH